MHNSIFAGGVAQTGKNVIVHVPLDDFQIRRRYPKEKKN